MISLKNINWKKVSVSEILRGCTNSIFSKLNLTSPKLQELADYRLSICKGCPLLTDENQCLRDWSEKDNVKVERIVNEKYKAHLATSPNPTKDYSEFLEYETQLYIKTNKKYVEVDGKVYVGCGCYMVCKIFNPNSSCPALKWESVNSDQFN